MLVSAATGVKRTPAQSPDPSKDSLASLISIKEGRILASQAVRLLNGLCRVQGSGEVAWIKPCGV